MFKEYPFLDRFAAAADAGFDTVEYLFPYDHDPDSIAQRLARHNLSLALFNAPPGDLAGGERGLACFPERQAEFRASLALALDYACVTGAPRLHLMAGIGSGEMALATYKDALHFACDEAGAHEVDIMIEPLNARDAPGYLLGDFALAQRLIGELNRPNLKLQFDIYHRRLIHGEVMDGLQQLLPITGHIQVSSVPNRNEPSADDCTVLKAIDGMGYTGVIGCEYSPAAGTLEGLHWLKRLSTA